MWTGKGGGDHLPLERSSGPRLVAWLPSQEELSAVCPGAEASSARVQAQQPAGAGAAKGKGKTRAEIREAQRALGSSTRRA